MADKWISGAIKHPGALSKSAHAAGKSPMSFAREHQHDSGTTGRRARLALILRKMHHAGDGMADGGVVISGDVAEGEKETVRGEKKRRPFQFRSYRG